MVLLTVKVLPKYDTYFQKLMSCNPGKFKFILRITKPLVDRRLLKKGKDENYTNYTISLMVD